MPIVNKTHPEIIASRRAKGIIYLTIRPKEIYFPKQVCSWLGIEKGKYIHFINDGSSWSFFINDDPDGFEVTFDKGFKIASSALAGMFKRSTKRTWGDRMLVTKTKSIVKDSNIYEIITNKTYDQILKSV